MDLRGLTVWINGRRVDSSWIRAVTHAHGTGYVVVDPAVAYDQTYSLTMAYRPPRLAPHPAPLKRIRALPSFTPLRFAPAPKPREPMGQHKRTAFVRCYQRHRESAAPRRSNGHE